MRQGFQVVGSFSEMTTLRNMFPEAHLTDLDLVLQLRKFRRWYVKNRKVMHTLALVVPVATIALYQISPEFFTTLATTPSPASEAIPAMASLPVMDPGNDRVSDTSFFSGHGAILLHMLTVGFVTLVVTTFLKFTGRGDIVPLVVFVSGAVILYEVIGLFKAIYSEVETFLNM